MEQELALGIIGIAFWLLTFFWLQHAHAGRA